METNQFSLTSGIAGSAFGTETGFLGSTPSRSRDPVITHYRFGPEFKKADGDAWIVEGYASTDSVDEYNEIVDPESFRAFLPRFLEFPISLINHNWFEVPIGKVLSADIRERGLWVRIQISKSASGVWQLIQEGILKALSIGFRGRKYEEPDPDSPGSPGIWREIELVEISVVNVPANREALFSVAASKGISLTEFTKSTIQPTTTKQEGTGMELTEEVLTQKIDTSVGDKVKALTPTLEAAAKSAAEQATKTAIVEFNAKNGTLEKRLAEIVESLKGCQTTAEAKEMQEKAKADLSAILAENKRINARGLPNIANAPLWDVKTPLNYVEQTWVNEYRCSPFYARAMTNLPAHVFKDNEAAADLLRDLQEASDNLRILMILARAHDKGNYAGPQSLKYYHEKYMPLHDAFRNEFRKAMDTTENTDWIPTGMSAELTKMVELALEVANLFPSFSMPTKTYEWPIQTGHSTAYLPGESTSDAATAITASTPATSKTTFTAKKLAARVLTSTEFIEDDIVPVLPFIREEIALTIARAIDEVCLNGDTTSPHEDVDVTAGTDRRKAWLGLRAFANDNSKSTDTGSFAVADLHTIRAAMGKYGKNQRELTFIVSATQYFAAIADSNVATVDKFGALATYLTGELAAFEGVKIRTSEFVREDLNASGIYDNVTKTKAAIYCVHDKAWKIGDRRLLNIEAEKIIETDQFQMVGTLRKDFQPMHGTDSQVWIGYNVS